MRVLIVSDIHANRWALRAVARNVGSVDHVLCAGDAVNYGPDPRAALDWLRESGAVAVRGNNDHATAFGVDPRASPARQPLAVAVRDWTRGQLDAADLAWLSRLPVRLTWEIPGTRFAVVHATPRDPLYDYRLQPDAAEAFVREVAAGVEADVLVVGHTHRPLLRRCGNLQIVNPGSVGQPLDGDPRAAYAVWEDGTITLGRAEYDQTAVLSALQQLPIDLPLREKLVSMLRHARIG